MPISGSKGPTPQRTSPLLSLPDQATRARTADTSAQSRPSFEQTLRDGIQRNAPQKTATQKSAAKPATASKDQHPAAHKPASREPDPRESAGETTSRAASGSRQSTERTSNAQDREPDAARDSSSNEPAGARSSDHAQREAPEHTGATSPSSAPVDDAASTDLALLPPAPPSAEPPPVSDPTAIALPDALAGPAAPKPGAASDQSSPDKAAADQAPVAQASTDDAQASSQLDPRALPQAPRGPRQPVDLDELSPRVRQANAALVASTSDPASSPSSGAQTSDADLLESSSVGGPAQDQPLTADAAQTAPSRAADAHLGAQASPSASAQADQSPASASRDRRANQNHNATELGAAAASSEIHASQEAPAADAAPRPTPARSEQSVFALERTIGPSTRTLSASIATSNAPRPGQTNAPTSDDPASAVTRGLSAAVLQRGGALTLRLVPETLGQVRIDMTLDRGAVAVRLEAGTVMAHDLLEQNLAMLRSSLENKGLAVDRLSVHLTPGAPLGSAAPDNNPATSQGNADQRGAQHDASSGSSRGRQEHTQGEHQPHANHTPDPYFDHELRLSLSTVA